MNEHSYVDKLKRLIAPHVSLFWKIKDDYQGGVVDIFIEGEHRDLWVEAKYLKALPKRDKTLIDLCNPKFLSPLQQRWIERRFTKRKDTLVIAGSPGGSVLRWNIDWKEPIQAFVFKDLLIPDKEAAKTIIEWVNS